MSTRAATSTSPLEDLHRRLGAAFTLADGRRVADRFGEPAAEREILLGAAGLADRSWLDRLEMTGEDRHRFLNGQVTCDVQGLAPGRLAYGFFTSRQGKVLADVTLLAYEDRYRLELPAGEGEEIRRHLEKYILADRVEIGVPEQVAVAVVGPRSAEILAALGATPPPRDGAHVAGDLLGTPVRLARRALYGLPAVTLWLDAAAAAETVTALLERGASEGLAPVGFAALETVRVERGVPRFGADFGPEHLPQETGLEEEAVSYDKGCYLGQEVVARIHYRGGVNRMLRGLVFADGEPAAAGTELIYEGRTAGRVGTSVVSPAVGAVGLAIVHQRAAAAGTVLEVAGGGSAEVRDLPLVTP